MVQRKKFQRRRPQSKKRKFPADVLCILLLLALCLSIGLTLYRSGIDFADEGFLAYGAVRAMHGQVPNRDFVSLQPPLAFYTVAAMFRLFGTSLVSLRILGLGIYLGITLLIFGIARHLTSPVLSLAAAVPAAILGIPYFNFVPFSVWQGITASLAAALFLLRASSVGPSNRHRYYLALPAGALSAASMLFRQDQGLYSAISILVYMLALKWARKPEISTPNLKRLAGFWLGGMVLIFLPSGIYWFVVGALPDMFKQLIVFPLTTYGKTSSIPLAWFSLNQSFTFNAAACLYYLPPVIEILAAVWLFAQIVRRDFSVKEAKLTFITLWSALFWCQGLTRSDYHHLLITLAPFFVLCAWCWSTVLENLGRMVANKPKSPFVPARVRIVTSIGAGVLVAGYLLAIEPVFLPSPIEASQTVALPRAGVRVQNAPILENFIESLQSLARPGQSILCLPYQPMFYFLSERRNPTRWNYLWPGDQTPKEHQDLIRQAQSDPPAVIVVTKEADLEHYAAPILDYIHREYKHRTEYGSITIYLP